MSLKAAQINEKTRWQDLTEGLQIYEPGTSKLFHTGEWRSDTPVWLEEKCTHCLLCVPYCPDSCIVVQDGKRKEFDYDHCKGCGICVKACPFHAIEMKEGK
ncbi:MAG: 4Fe-4S dicluster domain-containing protein [Lachnospiraceae bacterium]|jgi:pyruvate ferredoxin oxidoreductase delta subunit|nr:4Fe-4S dicluster domain-containing protein [Lachnospiraceae bacterium]